MNDELLRRAYVALNNAHSAQIGFPDCFDENYSARVLFEIKAELENPNPEPVGIILSDREFYAPGFDQRIGRAIWNQTLGQFKDGAKLYAETN